jgi:hypothetical protein
MLLVLLLPLLALLLLLQCALSLLLLLCSHGFKSSMPHHLSSRCCKDKSVAFESGGALFSS